MEVEPMVSTSQPGKENCNDIFINELLLWMITNYINLTLFVIVFDAPQWHPTHRGVYMNRRTTRQIIHIQLAPREIQTTELDQEMDDTNNKYMKTMK